MQLCLVLSKTARERWLLLIGYTRCGYIICIYKLHKGYLLSFNFNKKKKPGVYDVYVGDKHLIEAVV